MRVKRLFKHIGSVIRNRDIASSDDWEMSRTDWFAVVGASFGAFLAILDIQITNASLREIQAAFGLDLSEAGWISTSYLIAEVAIIPLTGFLSSVFGLRRYLLVNGTVFLASSLLCGIAWNLESMVIFRVLQGLSGGTLVPMAFQIMLLFMPKQRRSIGLALFGLTATLAPTLGPSIGGWLTDTVGWRWNFFLNIGPGLLMLQAFRIGLPPEKVKLDLLRKMNVTGAIALAGTLAALTYILEEGASHNWFESESLQVAAIFGLSALAAFLASQGVRRRPLLDFTLLKRRDFGIASLITMLSATALFSGIFALSIYLGEVQHYRASQIGNVMMWVGLPQLLVMPCVPYLMKHFDLRFLVLVGLSLFALSNGMNVGLSSLSGGDHFAASLVVRAIGQPLFLVPLSSIAMSAVTPSEAGNASSLFNVIRNVGGSIGISLTGTILYGRQAVHLSHNLDHLTQGALGLGERAIATQRYLMAQGLSSADATEAAGRLFAGITQRESAVQAFSDLYGYVTIIVVFCVILTLALSVRRADSTDFGSSH